MLLHKKHTAPLHQSRVLLHITAAVLLTFFTAWPSFAESRYIQPSAEIPIRSGQGTKYKILAVVPNGLQVEVLEENDTWALVRTPGGTEGWMIKRYLSNDPPLTEMVASLQAQQTQLKDEKEETGRKFDELLTVYSQNQQELNTCIGDRDETKKNFQTLQQDTADVTRIKKESEEVSLQLQTIRKKMTAIQQENDDLKRNTAVKWFLAGGGVLLIGVLIGMINRRGRKRKSSLF